MVEALTTGHRRWRRRIFAVTWLAYGGFYLCRKNFSVCMPLLAEDLGYVKKDFAIIIMLYSIMYAAGQFYNGILADRFGPRLIVGLGLILSVCCSVVMGFGTALWVFMVMFALNGVGQATGWPGTVKNMATWFRRKERGVVMGWWCTCYVVGGIVATVFATFCATNTFLLPGLSWRRGFWVPAIGLGMVAVIYITFTRNRPSDVGLPNFPEDDEAPAEPGTAVATLPDPPLSQVLREVLSKRVLWVTGISYFFVKLTRYAFIFWLPLYMTEALQYKAGQAGYTSSVYEFVGFAGVVAGGYMSDKVFRARRFPVVTLMLYGLALACFIHPHLAALGALGNAIGIGLIGMMTYGPDALMSGPAAQDMGSQRGAATAAGFVNGLGSCGQVLSPIIVVFVSDKFGWNSLFYIFVVFALISATLMATFWNYGTRQEQGR